MQLKIRHQHFIFNFRTIYWNKDK